LLDILAIACIMTIHNLERCYMKNFLLAIIIAVSSQFAFAQDRVIRVVITQSSSSGLANLYAHLEKFASKKNISMIPVYKPGANGMIGINYAISEQNNNILLLSTITDYVAAGSEKNFKNIGAINEIEFTLVASKKSGIKTLDDLVNIEKTNPGKLNWAQYSSAAGAFIDQLAKIHQLDEDKIHRIRYKDPRVSDIVGGDVDVAFLLTSAARSLSGRITIIDVDNKTQQRMAEKKNVTALFAPASQTAIASKFWNSFLNEFLSDNDTKEAIQKTNGKLFENTSPEKLETIIAGWKNK
jgi:hypothetical protein